jgi:hypothetical protein
MTTKQCTKCGEHKLFSEFNSRSTGKYGLDSRCKACYKAYADSVARSKSLGRYGMTEADYDTMLTEQGGGCAICGGTTMPPHQKYLAVDHCHDSMLVRGLLCSGCNHGLGHFFDNPERLRKAAAYLEKEPYAFVSRR